MELSNIKQADLCVHREIVSFQKGQTGFLRAIVLAKGDIFYVPSKAAKMQMMFFKKVEELVGAGTRAKITPIEYDDVMAQLKQEKEMGLQQDSSKVVAGSGKRDMFNSLEWLFSKAIKDKATDVYLILERLTARVEFKIYGQKVEIHRFQFEQGRRLASLMWTEANGQHEMKSSCDCSFGFDCEGKTYRVRANSVCTSNGGCTIAARVRDPKEIRSIEELGYSERQLEMLRDITGAPGGLVLFTGATNSGKSTTVTSLLSSLPTTMHIIEVADPVEVELPNCVHIEIDRYHEKHEEMFGQVLASIVRQNPDVLSLGEIRDDRTAKAAVNMALQGKQVYSTVHSTTASSVFVRLNGLGVDDHVLALPDFIAGIVSQNLVPVSCSQCAMSYTKALENGLDPFGVFEGLTFLDYESLRFANKEGCDSCIRGVAGQTLVAEVHPYVLDDGGVYKLIQQREFFDMEDYMRRVHGAVSKAEHAIEKMNSGMIDPVATLRIVGSAVFENHKRALAKRNQLDDLSNLPEPAPSSGTFDGALAGASPKPEADKYVPVGRISMGLGREVVEVPIPTEAAAV